MSKPLFPTANTKNTQLLMAYKR